MKTWIITIASVLVICLLLGFLTYAEFGSFNFIRVGLALSEAMGGEGVYQIAGAPERAWIVGTRGGLAAFEAYLQGEGYILRMDEQMGAQIPVEKDGVWDYIYWSSGGMVHKFRWESAGVPARAPETESDPSATLYTPDAVIGSAYFYPEADTEITAETDLALSFRYPAAETIHTAAHSRLYWEGETDAGFSMDEGFCVKAEDTAAFLEDALSKLGLTPEERADLLIACLPRMQESGWNLISFHDHHDIRISPAPDTAIGVFLLWKPLDEPMEIQPQILTAPERSGFTVVQWGGGLVK